MAYGLWSPSPQQNARYCVMLQLPQLGHRKAKEAKGNQRKEEAMKPRRQWKPKKVFVSYRFAIGLGKAPEIL